MSPSCLLKELDDLGISLWVEEDNLRFRAPSGAMTPDLKARIVAAKDPLLRRLGAGCDAAKAEAEPTSPEKARFDVFDQTPLQQAYVAGRSDAFTLGGFDPLSYMEFERPSVDLERAEQALNRLIEKHDTLRLVLLDGGKQQVMPAVPAYRIPITDLRACSVEEIAQKREEIRTELCERRPESRQSFLFDFHWTIGETVRLHSVINLVALDARSCHLFFREWFALIDGDEELPAPRTTFRQCVVEGKPSQQARESARRYWDQVIEDLPPGPELPPALPGSAKPDYQRFSAVLSSQEWTAFRGTCKRYGVTPSCALATVFANVLSCWSENEDLSLNLTLFNRPLERPDIERVLGEFTDITLLGFRNMDRPWAEQMREAGHRLLDHIEHSALAGVEVLRTLGRKRQNATGALMPVVFTSLLISEEEDLFALNDWVTTQGISRTPQVTLDHQVYQKNGGLLFNWDVACHAVNGIAVESAFHRYVQTLKALCSDQHLWDQVPDRRPPENQLDARRRRMRLAPSQSIPAENLVEAFRASLSQNAQREALILDQGRMSYDEFAVRSSLLASQLNAAGVVPGDKVVIRTDDGACLAIAVTGVLFAGAVAVVVRDESAQTSHHDRLCSIGARAEIVGSSSPKTDAASALPRIVVDPFSRVNTSSRLFWEDRDITSGRDDPAFIFVSAAVEDLSVTHGEALDAVGEMLSRFDIAPDDRVLISNTPNFNLFAFELLAPLYRGAAIVFPSAKREETEKATDLLRKHAVTILSATPDFAERLLTAYETGEGVPAETLRLAFVQATRGSGDLADRFRCRFPETRFIALNRVGGSAFCSHFQEADDFNGPSPALPHGWPLGNREYRVLDVYAAERPDFVCGTLNRVFETDETSANIETEDVAYFQTDGALVFAGRKADRVTIGGHSFDPQAVARLLEGLEGVARARIAREEKEGRAVLVASVSADPARVAESELRRLCAASLPAYMVPVHFRFSDPPSVTVPESPDEKAIRVDPAEASTPQAKTVTAALDTALIRAALEECFAAKIESPEESFFNLGVTSLQLVEAHKKLSETLNVGFHVTDMFFHPSLKALEQRLQSLKGGE